MVSIVSRPGSDDVDFWVRLALDEIKSSYGLNVSASLKRKSLLKFGINELVGTDEATVMTLPAGSLHETYASTNAITHLSSSSGSDTGTVNVEGHTVNGSGEFTFLVQSATLTGQTKKALSTPLARITRVYNTGSANWVGSVYGFEDDNLTDGVPDTAARSI